MEIIDHGLAWVEVEVTAGGAVAMILVAFALMSALAAAYRSVRQAGERGALRADATRGAGGESNVVLHEAGPLVGRQRDRVRARLVGLRTRLRGRPFLQDNLLFLSRWANAPRQVGSVAPSSRSLGRAMAAELPAQYHICVELGGGTGSLTRSLLAAGVSRDALVVVERDPRLAAYLRRRFPGVRILLGDAQHLPTLLSAHGIEEIGAVVSSLPLRSLPRKVGEKIVAASFGVLAEDGVFVQYTYGLLPPVPEETAHLLSLAGHPRRRVWNNLPPATVWRYRRARA